MDTDETLEELLATLEPAPVSDRLEDKVLAIFDGQVSGSVTPEPDKVIPFPFWQRIGAAAAVLVAGVGVFFAVLNSFEPKSQGDPVAERVAPVRAGSRFQPVSAENIFEGVRDGGVFIGEDGGPVRELRYQFSDSYLWQNPEDGSKIEVTLPRERRYIIPVRTD